MLTRSALAAASIGVESLGVMPEMTIPRPGGIRLQTFRAEPVAAECHQVLVSGEPVPTEAVVCGTAAYEAFILLSLGGAGGLTCALQVTWR